MADIRCTVNTLVEELGLTTVPIDTRLDLYEECASCEYTEDKLAGFLLLAEHSIAELRTNDVERLGKPLSSGNVADWNSCDWLCVKVIGPFIDAGGHGEGTFKIRAKRIAEWRSADTLWQRRAAAVSFVYLAGRDPEPFAGFRDLLLDVCETNTSDPARFSQTSVGWLLRELSVVDPDRVKKFLFEHPELSDEARNNATKRMGGKKKKRKRS